LNWTLSPPVSGCAIDNTNFPNQVLTCDQLGIPPAGAVDLIVSTATSALACGQMDNTASITGTNNFLHFNPPLQDDGHITCSQKAGLTKSFAPTSITIGGTTTLTFTITNPAANNPAQQVSFTDTLPSKLQIAAIPNIQNTCTGGTVTANAGATTITVANTTVGASGAGATVCTVKVDVTNVPLQVGTCPDPNLTNTFNSISNPINIINNVTDSCVTVNPKTPSLNKAFSPTSITIGGTTTLTFTVTNPAANNPAQTVSFTDTLPTKLQVAAIPNVGGTCTGAR
jgi:uncharacterized repeat protein (TIGR01451 family)